VLNCGLSKAWRCTDLNSARRCGVQKGDQRIGCAQLHSIPMRHQCSVDFSEGIIRTVHATTCSKSGVSRALKVLYLLASRMHEVQLQATCQIFTVAEGSRSVRGRHNRTEIARFLLPVLNGRQKPMKN
jgi:hypothetical protein